MRGENWHKIKIGNFYFYPVLFNERDHIIFLYFERLILFPSFIRSGYIFIRVYIYPDIYMSGYIYIRVYIYPGIFISEFIYIRAFKFLTSHFY